MGGAIVYEHQFVAITHLTTTGSGEAPVKLLNYSLLIIAADHDR
jgi:hypothetical protein